jgi:hypothetical protein
MEGVQPNLLSSISEKHTSLHLVQLHLYGISIQLMQLLCKYEDSSSGDTK